MNTDDLVKLSQDVVRKRILYNITQIEIANAIGVSPGTICRWESRFYKYTRICDLIAIILYLESKGVNFDNKKIILTNKTPSKT